MAATWTRITRDVVTVSGPDAATYLQGQVSQDVAALPPGGVTWTFVLQPQGKVDGWARVTRPDDDRFRLDTDPGAGSALHARLTRFLLRTKAEVELAEAVPVLAVRGGEVAEGIDAGWPTVGGVDVFAGPDGAEPAPPADAAELPFEAYEALRIRAGIPAVGAELTEDTIPAEAGQAIIDRSVSFTKGCFTGQELVARIDSRGGHVPRHVRGVVLDAPAPAGSPVTLEGQEVGHLTSVATGVDGRTVALASIHRSVEPPADATVAGAPVRVVALPIS